jgi:hypothetical protein
MEWLTLIAAITAAGISALTLWKLQDKKRNDDLDIKAFENSLAKQFKEFEQNLIKDNSYLSEKGKNEAIKEDLEEINRKLESIKTCFSKKGTLFKLQAEKEFEVYSKIWELITDLKPSLERLRPIFDYTVPDENKREKWSNRYKEVVQKVQNLQSEIEKHRPFYPQSLHIQLRELINKVHEEVIDFEFSLDEKQEKMSREGYKRGRENLAKITKHLDEVCEIMRTRISES